MATEINMPMGPGPLGEAGSLKIDTGSNMEVSIPSPVSAAPGELNETPSPSTPANPNSASRRPPRKSTLTQQQKNQKRQRATQDQLTTLEQEFAKNPTPTATVRDRIAEEINMTERSVQIWFQNRRAKIKLMAKKSLETGEDIDSIPESMRTYLAMQAMESGKGFPGAFLGRGMMPYGHGNMLMAGEQGGPSKVVIHHLTCRSLSIGKWTRVGQNTMDLIVFYSPDKCTMTYYINNEQAGYKIEYHFSCIKSICVENADDPTKVGGIVIELNRPPSFFMDQSPTSNGFFQCGDFTEDQQASQCLVHHLGGNPKVLSGQLAKLVSLESFMNRHNTMAYHPDPMAHGGMPVSAPVSPTNRPSSQPNFAQPHVGLFQESQWGISPAHHVMRGPGHKRQRSRSVPIAVDFSMLQTPMPSFYIQHPGEAQPQPHSPNIYAPVPQQPHALSPAGPGLRIDTQAGFGLDMRQYPMSATTAPSPSEYNSPSFFSQAPENTPLPASNFNTPYSSTFLSPMMNATNLNVPQSVSPISFSGGDPAIVDQSPPMSMLGRSASADIYHGGDSSAISDDGHSLNDMYSKHAITLPMHPPHSPAFVEPSQAELDMNQLVQFDTVDPSSLSPESVHQGIGGQ
ncbi:Transcription elongation factor SPT4 [Pyricularia oryzae]|uniref:Pyriculol/pyriculariol biosynthesis cluster transcription factor 1 n=4 Tax=Pyricularia TaxID=48558 RepID=TRF2_PYRO7|nr:homeoprotein [Pyricularia oryzae 70-15]G4N2B2.1 RecName: Full=Pyriculol/pyriculariol biosynthesis cluster transcription factor 1 [Pyricularia oryzae 70-15]KAH8847719.1 Transcription elongation factor SPT4 [Pyricularia oryzae]KAI6291137.1 Transcription elongation factor SPT4 [Pyricularia grisea]EHA52524.1 homeoprotein [Pyricularia oryzae 70-15]KAH9430351.1 Transcription elongation factor SPT4 [Pyricularia oryzae]KAI6251747.1 Transcription elongation factor SPT4 [Pyricularia oryzae]